MAVKASLIAIVVPQSFQGSTMIGRMLPLAQYLAQHHTIHLLHLGVSDTNHAPLNVHSVGQEPFLRTPHGKTRLKGFALLRSLVTTALRVRSTLSTVNPDYVIVSKTLPHTMLGVWLWKQFSKKPCPIIIDVDDFELTANVLTSIIQRTAIHWAERKSIAIASRLVGATPFLCDHLRQLSSQTIPITMIPTGVHPSSLVYTHPAQPTLLYIGSLSKASGHRVDLLPSILDAVRHHIPTIRLIIAGSGDDENNLKDEFKRLSLDQSVTWHGRFTESDLPSLLKDSSLMLDPVGGSITERAKSSFRTIMAVTVGMPVVTSNIGIRPYFIPDTFHDRFFAEPGNVASYAKVIVDLVSHPLSPDEQKTLTNHSRQYEWDTLGNRYEEYMMKSV